jgi:hypothetical protein
LNQRLWSASALRQSATAVALGAMLLGAHCRPGVSPPLLTDPSPSDIGTVVVEPAQAELRVGEQVRLTATIRGAIAGSDTVVDWRGDAKVTIQPLPCSAPGPTRSCAADVVGLAQGTTVLLFSVHLRSADGPAARAAATLTIRP